MVSQVKIKSFVVNKLGKFAERGTKDMLRRSMLRVVESDLAEIKCGS